MKVTVKTMDAGSRDFELADDATVEVLKKEIVDKMNIPLDKQRLIFHGKVLKSDSPLKEYGVDGMVIHLVKSAPPPPAPGEPGGGPINQPRHRIVTSSVRQDDDHTITLEATQDMLFMSEEGLPSEGDIAQMTQNIVSQIVGALSSHGASGTVSAEATATDNEGKTHVLSASASTKKPGEIKTEDVIEEPKPLEGLAKTLKEISSKPADSAAKAEPVKVEPVVKATPKAPPPSQPSTSSSAATAATGQEEEVKSKPAEKKSEAPPPRRSLFDFDDDDDPDELERLEQERIQRSMKNLYSHARTVRRCLQYATKILDRYDKSQERVAKKKAEDEAKRAAGIPLDQEKMVDLREAMLADRRKAMEEDRKADEKMELSEDDPFAILHSGRLDFIPSQLYLKFKDELDQIESRAQPIIREFRRLVEENQNLDDDDLVQAQRVAITVKDFNYYIGHAYVALGRLDVQLDRPAPRHLRLYAPRRTEMRRIFQQLRSMPPQPPSGYIIDIQREGEGGAGGGTGGTGQGQGRSTRAMISRGPAGLFGGLGGLGGGGGLGGAMGGQSRTGGLEELANRTSGPEFKAKLDEVKKDQEDQRQKVLEELEKEEKEGEGSSDKAGEATTDSESMVPDTTKSTVADEVVSDVPVADKDAAETKTVSEAPKLELKEDEAMDTSEQPEQMEEDKKLTVSDEGSGTKGGDVDVATSDSGGAEGGTGGGATAGATGTEGEKKDETGEKKEGEEGEEDAETPQYLARLLSELITGMVAPGMEAAPNDAIHDVEKKKGGASDTTGGGASAGEGDKAEGSKPSDDGGTKPDSSASSGHSTAQDSSSDATEAKEEPKKMSFAERYAGPEGTTVTIKAAPQMPSFPGLPPMEGPSVSIRNPGGGKPPEAVVNFPMPPAFQLLRMMLRRAQMRERQEQEAAAKEEAGEGGAKAEGEEETEKKPKKPKLVLPPKPKEKPFVEDDGDMSSVSDAGSLDSIDSDDQGPKDEEILFGDQSLKGIGEHRSMHDAMAELRDHFGDTYDEEEEEEMGMVEMLLKAISHQISVIEVMSVFQGNSEPLRKLQQPLLNFLEDKVLYGAPPTAERKDIAVKNFLMNCQSSIRAIEHRVPLRDRGIDFARTIYKLMEEIFEEGYGYITADYTGRTTLTFPRSLKYWATRSSARFGGVVRHCLDGDGEEFEETIKLLMSTLFPPTTPPLILTMCSSSILKEIRRLKDNYHFTPPHMEEYIVWKEGATPTPNRSYPVTQYLGNYSYYHRDTPLPVIQKQSVPTEGGGASVGGASEGFVVVGSAAMAGPSASSGPQQPFSDSYLAEMPAKKRKLDTSELQTIQPPELLEKLFKKGFEITQAKPLKGEKTTDEFVDKLKTDKSLVSGVVEEFYYSIRERIENDEEDYDPEKYPNSHKFYRIRKWPGQKKQEEEEKADAAAKEEEDKKEGATGGTSQEATAAVPTLDSAKMDQEPSTSAEEKEDK